MVSPSLPGKPVTALERNSPRIIKGLQRRPNSSLLDPPDTRREGLVLSHLQLERLNAAALSAAQCERTTAVPAELTVSQWAVESGWGAHEPGNNCFGIKAYPGCAGIQLIETTEVIDGVLQKVKREFATFPSLAACFEEHGELISYGEPYHDAWHEYLESKSVRGLIEAIAPIYASAPDYASLLLEIAAMPEVVSAISNARLRIASQNN